MSLIGGMFALWIVLSVLALGLMYVGSTSDSTEAVPSPEDWETFERQ